MAQIKPSQKDINFQSQPLRSLESSRELKNDEIYTEPIDTVISKSIEYDTEEDNEQQNQKN